MDDPGVRRNDGEVVEGCLTPPQELVALAVAAELQLRVAGEGVGAAEDVRDDRVVDHQLGRRQRIDLRGVSAQRRHGLAHRGEVDHARHPGEVLHDHPSRCELYLLARLGGWVPGGERVDVVGRDVGAVLGAQQVLQQDAQTVGQPVGSGNRVQPADRIRTVTYLEVTCAAEAVHISSSPHSLADHPGSCWAFRACVSEKKHALTDAGQACGADGGARGATIASPLASQQPLRSATAFPVATTGRHLVVTWLPPQGTVISLLLSIAKDIPTDTSDVPGSASVGAPPHAFIATGGPAGSRQTGCSVAREPGPPGTTREA